MGNCKASTVEVEVGPSEVQSPSAVQQVCRQLELQETLSHKTKPQAKEKKILKNLHIVRKVDSSYICMHQSKS